MLRAATRRALAVASRPTASSRFAALSTMTKKTVQQSEFDELRERSLLRHVINTSTEGDADSVMNAMDTFWDTYFNGEGTKEWRLRGNTLDSAIKQKSPKTAMEIGAYCGYTAVRMGRLMPAGSKLISIEIDPLYAAIATKVRARGWNIFFPRALRIFYSQLTLPFFCCAASPQMVEHAGLSDRVSVEIGAVADRLPAIHRKYGLSGPLDAVLLDHDPDSYLPDLQMLEQAGHISKGTVVLCDWSLYPGSEAASTPTKGDEFMEYLSEIGVSQSTGTSVRGKQIFTVSASDWFGAV